MTLCPPNFHHIYLNYKNDTPFHWLRKRTVDSLTIKQILIERKIQ